jgi:NADH-quinone oxidoreductase subunit J
VAGAVLFTVIAALALAGGVGVVASHQPVHSALSLLLVLGSLAVDYLLLGAQFIAVLQVIIYAGAIVVLFVFIIMLLHARGEEDLTSRAVLPPAAAVSLSAAFGLVLLSVLVGQAPPPAAVDARFGTVQNIGRILFSRFLLPFEAASVLLLIGMIGAVALGKRLPVRSASLSRGASPAAAGELRR